MKVFLDDEKINNLIKNADIYIKEEQGLLESFEQIYLDFNRSYNTKNTLKISKKLTELNSSLRIINNNSMSDSLILTKTIEKYEDIIEKIKNERKDINQII